MNLQDLLWNVLQKVGAIKSPDQMARPQIAYPMQTMEPTSFPPVATMNQDRVPMQKPGLMADVAKQAPQGAVAAAQYDLPVTQAQQAILQNPYNPFPSASAQATPMPIPQVSPDPTAQLTGGPNYQAVIDQALQIAAQYGIPPSVLTGMIGLESGHGKSLIAPNNYTGYTAYDKNPKKYASKFATPKDNIVATAKTLAQDSRYKQAMKDTDNPEQMVKDIKAAGYASDPDYVAKVLGEPEYRKYLKK